MAPIPEENAQHMETHVQIGTEKIISKVVVPEIKKKYMKSHLQRQESLETRAVLIKISMLY